MAGEKYSDRIVLGSFISELANGTARSHHVITKAWRHKHKQTKPTSFPGSLLSASLSRWNRDPACGWSRDHLSIQNRRVGGYSSTFGREDDKIPPCCPILPADFSTTQILDGHMTSRNQGLCSND